MNRTMETSAAVHQLGENHIRTMNMPAGVVNDEYLKHMYEITTSSLGSLRTELGSLYRQLTTYADEVGPGDIEFHQIRTGAAAAIELADIYLSPTAFPQRALRPETAQLLEILRPSTTPSAPTKPSTPAQEDARHAAAAATPPTDGATDTPSRMQVDDDTIDLGLNRDDWEQYEKLLEEPMEQIFDPPTTDHDPRDGSCGLTPEPTLPPLGPGDTEVTVNTGDTGGGDSRKQDCANRRCGTTTRGAGSSDYVPHRYMPGMQKSGTHRRFVSPHQFPAIQAGGVDGEGQQQLAGSPRQASGEPDNAHPNLTSADVGRPQRRSGPSTPNDRPSGRENSDNPNSTSRKPGDKPGAENRR